MRQGITESAVEEAALGSFQGRGYGVLHGPDIEPDALGHERTDYCQVVLEQHLRFAPAVISGP